MCRFIVERQSGLLVAACAVSTVAGHAHAESLTCRRRDAFIARDYADKHSARSERRSLPLWVSRRLRRRRSVRALVRGVGWLLGVVVSCTSGRLTPRFKNEIIAFYQAFLLSICFRCRAPFAFLRCLYAMWRNMCVLANAAPPTALKSS